jgi:hypothetical protein
VEPNLASCGYLFPVPIGCGLHLLAAPFMSTPCRGKKVLVHSQKPPPASLPRTLKITKIITYSRQKIIARIRSLYVKYHVINELKDLLGFCWNCQTIPVNRAVFASNGIFRIGESCSNSGVILYDSSSHQPTTLTSYVYTLIDLLSNFRSGRLCA